MPIRQQRLHDIKFFTLKALANVTVSFEPHNVTGVFGANGSGKSSIIHTLLGIYKPGDQDPTRKNYRFSEFFMPTTHTRWIGSRFNIDYSYRDGIDEFRHQMRDYNKQDRWRPYYERRPERDVYFIGIDSCVPAIELEKRDIMVNLATQQQAGRNANVIRQQAGYIMNRAYGEYNEHHNNANGRRYIGLQYGLVRYSSLSMGAGEQRIFKILERVYNAAAFSLIVIDEIDLTLHTDALNRLINVLVARAIDQNLQIVFTSHREELTQRNDINVRHIHQTPQGTLCFNETNPDCIARLTGEQPRPIEIFVEDDLGEAIVRKATEELNMARHCSIKRFGAANNSFTLAAGMFLKGEDLDHISIVLDGDVYTSPANKDDQMKKIFSGTENEAVARRAQALSCIRQFDLPVGISPEQFINGALQELNNDSEVCNAALAVQGVLDRHQYVDRMIELLGYDNTMQGLTKVVDQLAITPQWQQYTMTLNAWLTGRKQALNL